MHLLQDYANFNKLLVLIIFTTLKSMDKLKNMTTRFINSAQFSVSILFLILKFIKLYHEFSNDNNDKLG